MPLRVARYPGAATTPLIPGTSDTAANYARRGPLDVTPSASRLTGSLRDVGYDFLSALADVVDNSVAAGASDIAIEIVFDGADSYVIVADDGDGMDESELQEALRFGTRREYRLGDLGRYGLGLKTASLSQARRLTVVTRSSVGAGRVAVKTLDLDHTIETDRWEIVDPPLDSRAHEAGEWLNDFPGTVVLWEHLDRVLPEQNPEGGWARRRLENLSNRAREYLGMVFHRYLEGSVRRTYALTITVNGQPVLPWNPFAPHEEGRTELPLHSFEVVVGGMCGVVTLRRYVLPPKSEFSSLAEFERMSGPMKWNRQQGLYIYRADRLIQHGGWSGIRAADEHTKFARASLNFQTDLDSVFRINVAKMRVALPVEVRTLLERPIHELCHRADAVYRRDAQRFHNDGRHDRVPEPVSVDPGGIGTALMVAALNAGEHESFTRIMERVRLDAPEVATSLGW